MPRHERQQKKQNYSRDWAREAVEECDEHRLTKILRRLEGNMKCECSSKTGSREPHPRASFTKLFCRLHASSSLRCIFFHQMLLGGIMTTPPTTRLISRKGAARHWGRGQDEPKAREKSQYRTIAEDGISVAGEEEWEVQSWRNPEFTCNRVCLECVQGWIRRALLGR
jgi:hypothetical protein